jgi:hypothetical protein
MSSDDVALVSALERILMYLPRKLRARLFDSGLFPVQCIFLIAHAKAKA